VTVNLDLGSLHELFWNSEPEAPPRPAVDPFGARVATVMKVRGLPRLEAERAAYEIILVERLNATHPSTPADRCAHCGRTETPVATLLPIGVGVRHAWLHQDCWARWREERRQAAAAELAAMGIAAP
jgi:hypothetical protein